MELEEAAGGFGDHIQQVRHAVLLNLKVGVLSLSRFSVFVTTHYVDRIRDTICLRERCQIQIFCMTLCQLTLDEGGTGTITQHPPAASTAHTQNLVPPRAGKHHSRFSLEDKGQIEDT